MIEQKKYFVISCHVLWRELCYFASQSEHIYEFHFLKQGLHNIPEILRKELQLAIDKVPEGYDAILIGYGLCSRGIEDITTKHTPLVLMRGHDCITFLLGSKEKYKEYFDSHPGTYWYSPGWIETGFVPSEANYAKRFEEYIEKYGQENAEYLMTVDKDSLKRYTHATYVDLGCSPNSHFQEYTQQSAKWLGWNYERIQGNPQLIKNFLNGDWNTNDFLIVHPGEKIVFSFDNSIIKTEPV